MVEDVSSQLVEFSLGRDTDVAVVTGAIFGLAPQIILLRCEDFRWENLLASKTVSLYRSINHEATGEDASHFDDAGVRFGFCSARPAGGEVYRFEF